MSEILILPTKAFVLSEAAFCGASMTEIRTELDYLNERYDDAFDIVFRLRNEGVFFFIFPARQLLLKYRVWLYRILTQELRGFDYFTEELVD